MSTAAVQGSFIFHFGNRRAVEAGLISVDDARLEMRWTAESLAEQAFGRRGITQRRQQEVDGGTGGIDHHWSDELLSGRVPSIAKIAERERVSARYVRRLMRLAFLAPKIVEMIAAGTQPSELTAEALAERIDLPLLWTAQEQAVGV
jgi:hypothetical protein